MMLEYKGYLARVEYLDDVDTMQGRVINIRDVVTFRGDNLKTLKRELRQSVEDYLAFCRKDGVEPEKPFSGKLSLRLPPELHKELAKIAVQEDTSLNSLIVDRLVAVAHAR